MPTSAARRWPTARRCASGWSTWRGSSFATRAGAMAVKEAARQASPVLLEPVMDVEVVTPADYMGEVMGDLSSRRGKIGGMTQRADAHVIAASVPLSEMFGYSTTLRSMSQGRAIYSMQFSHYQEVPKSKAEEIVSKVKG